MGYSGYLKINARKRGRIVNMINGAHFSTLERVLDAAALRQKAIAENIANVDTPYYKRSDVRFEELLQKSLQAESVAPFVGKRTDVRHLKIGSDNPLPEPTIIIDEHSAMNNNQNNVDIDSEMALLAKNQLRYNVVVDQVVHQFKMIRTALDGRT
jgi:flagellar basal-body rod protein FlgB